MVLSMESLAKRKAELEQSLRHSEDLHLDLKERMKDLKKVIANTKGAVLEIEHLMDGM